MNKFKQLLSKLSKEKVQKVVFLGVLILLFSGFFISLSFLPDKPQEQVETPIVNDKTPDDNDQNEKVPQVVTKEVFKSPMNKSYVVLATFFDEALDEEKLAKAVLSYDNTFITSNGLLLSTNSDEKFDVTASLSGKVTSILDNSLYGKTVIITHKNGYTTEYANLSEVKVGLNEEVKQGDVIASSGASLLSQNQNNLYFIVRKNSKSINPEDVFGKTIE